MNFPFLDGDLPRSSSYRVYISQLIGFARVSSHVDDFNTCNKVLTAKLLRQGYRYHKIRKAFSKFISGILTSCLNIMSDCKHFFCKTFQKFYGDLVYQFRKIIGRNHFLYHFKKTIARYKKIGYNIDVLRQTACLVVNPMKLNSFTYLLNCMTVRRASNWMTVPF